MVPSDTDFQVDANLRVDPKLLRSKNKQSQGLPSFCLSPCLFTKHRQADCHENGVSGRRALIFWCNLSKNMTCPFCAHRQDRVIDSRESKDGDVIRRRRECLKCERRFTTYERCDEVPYVVVKRDGRREKFDRQKVLESLLKACAKRPVGMAKLAAVVDEVESLLADNPDREMSTNSIGELVMGRLRAIDKIAYVRFASVYRDFQDVEAFLDELKDVLQKRS